MGYCKKITPVKVGLKLVQCGWGFKCCVWVIKLLGILRSFISNDSKHHSPPTLQKFKPKSNAKTQTKTYATHYESLCLHIWHGWGKFYVLHHVWKFNFTWLMVVNNNKCKHKHHNATTLPKLNIATQRHLAQEGEFTSVSVISPPLNGVWWLACNHEVDVEFTNYSCKL